MRRSWLGGENGMMLLKELSTGVAFSHDWGVQVATAHTREATIWRNQQIDLSEFVRKLSRTVRTPETVEQFHAMPKNDQDQIKDVGGFVGGLLKGGSRSKHAVANRSMMTLDADHAKHSFLQDVHLALSDFSYTIYSTHKHTADKPRYRLIVYPSRPMLPDEYQACMRRIAGKVGIDQFDDTTYDINRLMYWPSTPVDGEFVFRHNDMPPIDADALLGEYDDWRDVTQWPQSDRENKRLTLRLDRQADPLEKKGVVGAFCRCVTIRQAIEIVGVYKQESKNRYTYIQGTSTKGAIVYQEKFLYSNHESDPISGQTVNAFDLLRLHKFGYLDTDAKPGTPTNRLPSYSAMVEFAREYEGVKSELVASGIDIDVDAFDDVPSTHPPKWLGDLQVTESGEIKTTFTNAVLIVQNDPSIQNQMRFNLLAQRVEHESGELWGEKHSLPLRNYVGRRYNVDFPEAKIEHAISHRAMQLQFHPVRDWLESLDWDGQPRLETMFIDWLRCEDNPYTRQAAKCLMVAAVSRAYEPGFKFDYVPVIGGRQGIGKSTMLAILGGDWYGELSSFDHKIAAEEMQGRWIMEITELGATNRSELEQQKAFISATSTTVRMAYARHPVEMKRQCVFIATTNQSEYLKDSTGNRRWWPIEAGIEKDCSIDLDGFREIVGQLWAEAHTLYQLGVSTMLDREARAIVAESQEKKRESDVWEGVVGEWLAKPADCNRYMQGEMTGSLKPREKVCVVEVWEDCLGEKGTPKRQDSNRIAAILDRQPDWQRCDKILRFGDRFGPQRGWQRLSGEDDNIPF